MQAPIRRLAAATAMTAVLAAVGVLGTAGPAAAHAVLIATTPADRAALDQAPGEVTLEFSEPVSTTVGSVRAFDAEGARVDEGDLRVEGTRVVLALAGGLGEGAYIVTYRVISQDAHPVAGAFAFTVGDATAADDDTIAGLLGEGEDRTWHVAGAVARGVAYAGALVAAGLGVFLVLAHDGGDEAARLRRWVRLSALVGGAALLVTLPIQAALVTGLGLGALTEGGVAGDVVGDNVGWSMVVVLAGLAVLAVAGGRARAMTLVAAVLATAGFALAGHTTTADPRWPVTLSDAVHAAAGAVWFGGLVGMVAVLRARQGPEATAAAPVVGRFSALAGVALVTLAVAGSLVGWREVRTLDALTSTTYGRLLVAKVAVVGAVALLGAWNRFRLVPAMASAPKKAASLLQRAVRVEAAALVAAVALTGLLVTVTPAATAAGIGSIFSETVPFGEGSVNVVVDPNRAGANAVHLYVFDEAGRVSQQAFDELTLRLSLPSAGIGPIERQPYVAGPGHFQLDGGDLSIPGDWTIEVAGRVDRFDRVAADVTVPVNP